MYRLMKLEGVDPEKAKELKRSADKQALEAERDRLMRLTLSTGGPGSLAKLRYGVRCA